MRARRICVLLFLMSHIVVHSMDIGGLTVEYRDNPAGVTTVSPRFSWILVSSVRGDFQTAYQIEVSNDPKSFAADKLIWNTGKVISGRSINVVYEGQSLKSLERYYWRVRVWGKDGRVSRWSGTGMWQMGIMDESMWLSDWIEPSKYRSGYSSHLFRKAFTASETVRRATLCITAHGIFHAYINGERVGQDYLAPGWTSYNNRLEYRQYDVTDMIVKGINVIGAEVGGGWYRSHIAWGGTIGNFYGDVLGLLAQLQISYDDGSEEIVGTDASWKTSPGNVVYSEIYNGETVDGRIDNGPWCLPLYDDSDWDPVFLPDTSTMKKQDNGYTLRRFDKGTLVSTLSENPEKLSVVYPTIFTSPDGERILDYGQNLVGWERATLSGAAGDTIRLLHAEVLDEKGNFYTENLRAAKATSTYILGGDGRETFEPKFTFYGFRYIKIEGVKYDLSPRDFPVYVVSSNLKQTGKFKCSNELVNRLQHNIVWSQRDNFLDIPTDCPQRDERLGWTGDAMVFARTASFNMKVVSFFRKWLMDVVGDQRDDGMIPNVIPHVGRYTDGGSAGWGDVITIVPWIMFRIYDDREIIRYCYPAMKKWLEYYMKNSKDYLCTQEYHFGDHLSIGGYPFFSEIPTFTDKKFIAQCYFAYSASIVAECAGLLGLDAEKLYFKELSDKVKKAFNDEYVTPNGRMSCETQTAYLLVLKFDMVDDSLKHAMAERLAALIRKTDCHLSTGFLGTPLICEVLTEYGYEDLAYRLLLQDSCPSWLYPVKCGATTIWERWDGIKPDGTLYNPDMNSFNHYAYGAVGDWLYRYVAGIREAEPGYKKIIVSPLVSEYLTYAEGSIYSNYGEIYSRWERRDDGTIFMKVLIPVNTVAEIFLPVDSVDAVRESGRPIKDRKDMTVSGICKGKVNVSVGSGEYEFVIK